MWPWGKATRQMTLWTPRMTSLFFDRSPLVSHIYICIHVYEWQWYGNKTANNGNTIAQIYSFVLTSRFARSIFVENLYIIRETREETSWTSGYFFLRFRSSMVSRKKETHRFMQFLISKFPEIPRISGNQFQGFISLISRILPPRFVRKVLSAVLQDAAGIWILMTGDEKTGCIPKNLPSNNYGLWYRYNYSSRNHI